MFDPGAIVTSGSLLLALPVALLAGLVSFLSPCVLPLVPGYLGYVTGATEVGSVRRGRTVLGAALFVAGFSVVFLLYVVLAATAGRFLLEYESVILRVSGALVLLMGLVFLGKGAMLQRTVRPAWMPATGLAGAPLLGAVFGVGWTPCIGPTLAAVISLSFYEANPMRALLIGAMYCVGLGLPFVFVAVGIGWVNRTLGWVRRHIRAVNVAGGAVLVAIGLLMVSGVWQILMARLGAVIGGFETAI